MTTFFKKNIYNILGLSLILSFIIVFRIAYITTTGTATTTPETSQKEKVSVLVTVLPQQEFVRAVGGEHVDVTVLVPAGFNPESFELSPAQLRAVTQADIYFLAGHLPFEQQYLDKFREVNPNLKIVDLSAGIPLRQLDHHHHDDTETAHSHAELVDPHSWMSARIVRMQLPVIQTELSQLLPKHSELFSRGQAEYSQRLAELDERLQVQLQPLAGGTVLVYHPAFGYFLDDYQLHQEFIEVDGKEPSLTQLQSIVSEAKADDIRVIFVQQQFSQEMARAVADDIDGVVIALDDLAPNYIENLSYIGNQIHATLTGATTQDAN